MQARCQTHGEANAILKFAPLPIALRQVVESYVRPRWPPAHSEDDEWRFFLKCASVAGMHNTKEVPTYTAWSGYMRRPLPPPLPHALPQQQQYHGVFSTSMYGASDYGMDVALPSPLPVPAAPVPREAY